MPTFQMHCLNYAERYVILIPFGARFIGCMRVTLMRALLASCFSMAAFPHGASAQTAADAQPVAGAQAACRISGSAPLDPRCVPTPMSIAQARAKAEALVAVGRPGVKVCRALVVGIAVRDWIRGEVIEVRADRIGVRIADPGRQPHVVDDKPLVKGATVWSDATEWTPCI